MADYIICPGCGASSSEFEYCIECGQIFCKKCLTYPCPTCGNESYSYYPKSSSNIKELRNKGDIIAGGHIRYIYEDWKFHLQVEKDKEEMQRERKRRKRTRNTASAKTN